jgi:tyrosyl-tRNA synthetase
LFSSKKEVREFIESGAVSINEEKVLNFNFDENSIKKLEKNFCLELKKVLQDCLVLISKEVYTF